MKHLMSSHGYIVEVKVKRTKLFFTRWTMHEYTKRNPVQSDTNDSGFDSIYTLVVGSYYGSISPVAWQEDYGTIGLIFSRSSLLHT